MKGEKLCFQIGFIDKWDFSAIEDLNTSSPNYPRKLIFTKGWMLWYDFGCLYLQCYFSFF